MCRSTEQDLVRLTLKLKHNRAELLRSASSMLTPIEKNVWVQNTFRPVCRYCLGKSCNFLCDIWL